ncbi:transglutaminase TgpA family protein [Parendozoicomonas haliclonae]|uniref:Protein-glutamine gamma-glutamyltransferase n=1 Tax=Parendozoicomonas haliclonae TaxID=1960125 RepID=A0A1X7AKN5_9GAMM|nr:DUF3488 and transglutaminase-like domain-containing protein [Parendozoicomonas haliclonae]SMA47559.1 Protein-glutamine gamma-glutamyltransferase [Parendozoicomonas haliclonae]
MLNSLLNKEWLRRKRKTAPAVAPVTRAASFSLVFILVLVCLPLAPLLPAGTWVLVSLVVGWRLILLRARGAHPGKLIRTLLVVVALALVLLHYGTLLGLEAGATTLVSAYTLKLLEMRSRRDALVLSFMGFFVVVTGLLFSQSIAMTGYLLVCLVALVSVLVGLHQPGTQTDIGPALRTGLLLSAQALPLMVILFVLVPRIPPLWAVPHPDNSARTGLSDEMAPGDIARLSQSGELAFRATFTGEVPPPEQRYWRAVVMYWFDGRRWSQGDQKDWQKVGVAEEELISWYPQKPAWAPEQSSANVDYRYDIILEPSGRPWLPVLGPVNTAVQGTGLTRDWRLLSRDNVDLLRQYSMPSSGFQGMDAELPTWLKAASLQLPATGNARARQWAEELASQYGSNTPALVSVVLRHFREQDYYYTLRPPTLSGNTIDAFLFDTRRGFCAHYAGALTFILRAAGIPSRVVAGYQGGEVKEGGVVQVRQFDAHAWVEYWQAGYGWQRVDPTAAVAPERVEQGLEQAVAEEGSFLEGNLFSPVRYRHIDWVNTLRLQYEQLEYQWQRLVLSYDEDAQKDLFKDLFPGKDTLTVLLQLLVITVLLVMVISLIWVTRPWQQKLAPADRYYQQFCQRMKRKGLPRHPGEGPEDYALRIKRERPEWGQKAQEVTELYIRLAYANQEPQSHEATLQQLKRLACI